MKCPNCKRPVEEGNRCSYCGHSSFRPWKSILGVILLVVLAAPCSFAGSCAMLTIFKPQSGEDAVVQFERVFFGLLVFVGIVGTIVAMVKAAKR